MCVTPTLVAGAKIYIEKKKKNQGTPTVDPGKHDVAVVIALHSRERQDAKAAHKDCRLH